MEQAVGECKSHVQLRAPAATSLDRHAEFSIAEMPANRAVMSTFGVLIAAK
ncbi:hypothetical protein [Rhodopseudomonas faecalis]|uniref:hypothetical protein n=1 Tax=Rhodopseudomonas faecalis TaxID=99655 RepID=UPI0015E8B6CD|nr:hypothetical protein [Rhodopseudomonas faecalis]